MHNDERLRVKDETINLRLSGKLKQDAFWAATEDNRSLSSYVVTLIINDLKERERSTAA